MDDEKSSESSDGAEEYPFMIRQCVSHDSDDEDASKINLLVPSTSSSTLIEKFNEHVDEIADEVKKRQVGDLTFSREELLKKLENLVKKSIKNFDNDDEVNNEN